ncbi:hypothetical protein GCM10028809_19310 [Spirosoma gilvum]
MLIACGCHLERPNTFLTNDDYALYSVYLNSFTFYKNVPSAESIILEDSTTMNPREIHPKLIWAAIAGRGDRCQYLKDTVSCQMAKDGEWGSVFEEFKHSSLGKQEFLVPAKFNVRYPIQLLSQLDKMPSFEQRNDKRAYYTFRLSKISYNADKTKALFFGSFVCGGKCGRGELLMLEKGKNTWRLIDTFRFWIA